MSSHDSITDNGAVTHSTSDSKLVDFFFQLGTLRGATSEAILTSFIPAFYDAQQLALKALFYARDVRGGQGERDVFKTCLEWLANKHPDLVIKNFSNIVEFGRWSDFIVLINDTPVSKQALQFWANAIFAKDPLACKWAPREKSANSTIARSLRKTLDMSPKTYRKHLAANTKVVEHQMCAGDWENINYSHVPARAMKIYRSAFERNSSEAFGSWVESLVKGEVKVNSKTLYPHELVRDVSAYSVSRDQEALLSVMWDSLPDYFKGNSRTVLPIIDVSSSMSASVGGSGTTSCMDVAIGLGIYCAERTQGPFKNKFITFADRPKLISIPDTDFAGRVASVQSAPWGGCTNFQSTFDLILESAIRSGLHQSDLPDIVLCVSDMEFDQAEAATWTGTKTQTNFEAIREKFSAAGYSVPQLVFWNVSTSNTNNVPIKFTDNGAMVSGFSPSIMKAILSADQLTPMSIVLDTLCSERYKTVKV
jgi:hypothetical protein